MEEYRHGHGLLRGCFREISGERLAVNERPIGIEFVLSTQRQIPQLLWADEAFIAWSRMPGQVSVAERAFRTAQKLGIASSPWDDLRMRPHRATEESLVQPGSAGRFRRLAGPRELTNLFKPAALSALPVHVLIESSAGRLAIYLPLTYDPSEPLVAVLDILGLQYF